MGTQPDWIPADVCGYEWSAWYLLSPAERFAESMKLWNDFLMLGGSLDPEPDTQSPFYDAKAPSAEPPHGGASLRIVRRGGV